MDGSDRYPNIDTVRWVVDISQSGDCVVIDDGAKWHIVPSHRDFACAWPRTLKVRIHPVQGRLYTLSAEKGPEVQAIYQGFRPHHEKNAEDEQDAESRPLLNSEG
jgi:hypothetical protein